MKIKINIDEIEFEVLTGQSGKEARTIEFSFHDQIRIRKAFEKTLEKLFSDTKDDSNDTFSIRKMLNSKSFFTDRNLRNINLGKEIDGGEFFLSLGDRTPLQIGKRLAESIYISLNMIDYSSNSGVEFSNKKII